MLSIERTADVPADFLPDHAEGGAFQRAYARAQVPGFELGCFTVRRDGEVVCIAPFFAMRLPLNTMMPPGILKTLMAPLSLRMAFVGHPSADVGRIHGDTSPEVLALVNDELLKLAPLVSYKGFDASLQLPGFHRVIGLPVPVLTVSPDYWAELKHKVRTDLKRKLKGAASLRFEEVDGLPEAHVARVHALYRQTCDNADIQFEQLNPGYFRETGPLSKYIFYFEGEQMLGFHQLMCDRDTMYCKYIGMDYAKAHEHKLYFALMLQAVNICIRDGIRHVDFGVTSYAFKRQLGCEMHPTYNHFKHRNRWLNKLLTRISFLLEPSEDELR